MTKSTSGRKTTARKKTPARAPARRAPAKKAPARRRNPSPRSNPSFVSRATSAYSKAGGVVLGGVAAEQAKNLIDKFAGGKIPASDIVSSIAPGALGVYLMGNKSELAKNVGLGMVATSAANTLGALIGKIGGGTATSPPVAGVQGGAPASRGLAAPRTRYLGAPAGYDSSYGGDCGCASGSAMPQGVPLPDGFN